ncbi:MAG: YjgN family protein [Gammaproteobacteria bacterium]
MKALSFDGSGMEYFKIWIVNVLLTILTLGLYHPWAKVRNNRYFYANSMLEGRNFEYHATGKQLFFGYLIAMTLLILYIIINQVSPTGSLILVATLFLAVPWLILRSMIFNMRMTSFSNVHFNFSGKIGRAYLNFFAYPIALYIGLILITVAMTMSISLGGVVAALLGVIFALAMIAFLLFSLAFIKKKNTEFFVDHSQYGQGEFKTNVHIKKLMMIALKTVGIGILVLLIAAIVVSIGAYATGSIDSVMALNGAEPNPELMAEKMRLLMPVIFLAYLMMIMAGIFIMAYSLTQHRKYVYANTRLDEKVTFASTLKAFPLAWVLITNFFAVILSLGFAYPWARVRASRIMLENTLVNSESGFDDYLTQKQNETSSLGEQIGDAFDIDAGLGF